MRVEIWGTRGSLPTPGAATARYGGNTSCISVRGHDGTLLVLDAGTGIRLMAESVERDIRRIDLLLTHLHMDHIQGLGFFEPLYRPDLEVHVWGPVSLTLDLATRLNRYLSPPLFPVRLRELPCNLHLHELPDGETRIGEFRVDASLVCHPGSTIGFRVTDARSRSVTYMPDHEPALGPGPFPSLPLEWTSGGTLARQTDLLIHDSQYTRHEYPHHVGWGHSSLAHVIDFATLAEVRQLVPFHYDPTHTDDDLDRMLGEAVDEAKPRFRVTPAKEGMAFEL